jgi:hypothetical protein
LLACAKADTGGCTTTSSTAMIAKLFNFMATI